MAIRDEDFDTDLTLAEGDDRIWLPSETAPARAPLDLRSLYERERARAEGAEARCKEKGSIRNFVLWAIVMKKKGASYGNREGTIGPAVGGA